MMQRLVQLAGGSARSLRVPTHCQIFTKNLQKGRLGDFSEKCSVCCCLHFKSKQSTCVKYLTNIRQNIRQINVDFCAVLAKKRADLHQLLNVTQKLKLHDMASVKSQKNIEHSISHQGGGGRNFFRLLFVYTHTQKWFFVQLLVDFFSEFHLLTELYVRLLFSGFF